MLRLWKWTSVSIGAPLLESMEGCSFPKAFERRENLFIYGNFCEEFESFVKMPCKQSPLSIGALLGNLERVRLLELLREKGNAYLGSFSLDPENIKC